MNTVISNKGMESINRIKLLMEYSLDKTLDENIKLILEENNTPYKIDGPYEKLIEPEFGSDIIPFDTNTTLNSKNDKVTVLYYIINNSDLPIIIQDIKGLGDFEYKGGGNINYTKQPILKNQKGIITITIQPRYDGKPVYSTFSSQVTLVVNNKQQTIKLPNISLNLPQSLVGNLTEHEWNTILQLGALAIPVVGVGINVGIGLYDAGLYYKEGKKSEAMITALFSLLPYSKKLRDMFSIFSNFDKNITDLSKKLVTQGVNSVLTNEEKQIVRVIDANKYVIESEIKILSKSFKEKGIDAIKYGTSKIKSGIKSIEPYFVGTLLKNELEKIEKDDELLSEIKNKILEENKNLFTKIDSFKILNKKNNYINDVIINGKKYYFPDPEKSYKLIPKNT